MLEPTDTACLCGLDHVELKYVEYEHWIVVADSNDSSLTMFFFCNNVAYDGAVAVKSDWVINRHIALGFDEFASDYGSCPIVWCTALQQGNSNIARDFVQRGLNFVATFGICG